MGHSTEFFAGLTNTVMLNSDEMLVIARAAEIGEHLQALLDDIENRGRGNGELRLVDVPAQIRVDKRWLAIARTDLQKGMMALTRAIARPNTF